MVLGKTNLQKLCRSIQAPHIARTRNGSFGSLKLSVAEMRNDDLCIRLASTGFSALVTYSRQAYPSMWAVKLNTLSTNSSGRICKARVPNSQCRQRATPVDWKRLNNSQGAIISCAGYMALIKRFIAVYTVPVSLAVELHCR